MSFNTIALTLAIFVVVLLVGIFLWLRLPRRLRTAQYAADWKELQGVCRDKKTWPDALTRADKLLDSALKKRKYKGKTMGERMVSAQKIFTNNDATWIAHNMTKKILAEPATRLKESEVKAALVAYRGALKDVGALVTGNKAPVTPPVDPVEAPSGKS